MVGGTRARNSGAGAQARCSCTDTDGGLLGQTSCCNGCARVTKDDGRQLRAVGLSYGLDCHRSLSSTPSRNGVATVVLGTEGWVQL